jgi:hypothetical protein
MNRYKRLRRVTLLCCHFARNFAYYKAGLDSAKLTKQDEFWATVNSNFLDICVIEWCKLFGDHSDKHHWKNIAGDESLFMSSMFTELRITQVIFNNCWRSIRHYRDKYLDHLDSDEVMRIPELNIAWFTVNFYHSYVVKICDSTNVLQGIPADLESYYRKCYSDAEKTYEK